MLRVFVLEDDFFQQGRIESIIGKIISSHNIKAKPLKLFEKADQLLEEVKEQGSHQVFFLDIQIGQNRKEGLELAKKIRSRDPYATIIFTSTFTEFLPVIFEYRLAALDFIDKMLSNGDYANRIEAALLDAINKFGDGEKEDAFYFETAKSAIQVPFRKILFFETSPIVHKILLHTTDGISEFYGQLSKIENLDERLYRCNKSFVVNCENITFVEKSEGKVHFENGEYCYVSKLKQKKLLEKVKSFVVDLNGDI